MKSVLIIEDEVVIATSIAKKLVSLGYDVLGPCATFDEAIEVLSEGKVDLALVDIRIKGRKDGIELAGIIRERFPMPIVFVTANGDVETLNRAKAAKPNAFVLKPFTTQDLQIAIEIALVNFEGFSNSSLEPKLSKYLVLKVGFDLVKQLINDIELIKSAGNYVSIKTRDSRVQTFRITLREIEEQLHAHSFFRVSKSCIVNFNYVMALESDQILIGEEYIPMGKVYRQEIEASDAFRKFR